LLSSLESLFISTSFMVDFTGHQGGKEVFSRIREKNYVGKRISWMLWNVL
jgi:hypothetical protein